MRALVTGSGGFVGTHLVSHLRSCGDDVTATDRAHGGPDIVDGPAMARLVAQSAPDVIYHLAGQADVGGSWRDPRGTFRSNAEGTLSVLMAAADADVARIVAVTSAEVYGRVDPAAMPVVETMALNPASPYAASKAAAEMLCVQWANQGLGVIRARAFNHLGPGQSEKFVAPALAWRLVRAQAAGQRQISVGNLSARRDFTDVRDVVCAYRALAVDGAPGEAYNVCSGVDHAIVDLAQLLLERTDPRIELVPDPELQRPSDVPVLRGDPSKIHAATGWETTIDLRTTVDDIVAAIRTSLASSASA